MLEAKGWFMTVTTALGLNILVLVCGLLGGLLSMFSLDPATATVRSRTITVLSGTCISYAATPGIGDYFELHPAALGMVALMAGLWGLSIVKESYDLIKGGLIKTVLLRLINAVSPNRGA